MALLMSFCRLLLLLTLLFSTKTSNAFDFEVGDDDGWTIPPSRNTQFYNHWASRNRFKVGDTIHFIYKKGSVMEVSAEDYDHCSSSHPLFFSNNGNTEFKLDHSRVVVLHQWGGRSLRERPKDDHKGAEPSGFGRAKCVVIQQQLGGEKTGRRRRGGEGRRRGRGVERKGKCSLGVRKNKGRATE